MNTNSRSALTAAGVLADLARLTVLIGTIAAALTGSIAAAGLFALVFALLLLPRITRIPSPFDLAVCVLLPLATLFTTTYWYQRFAWTDWVMHCLATGAVAAATYLMTAADTKLLPPIRDDRRATTVILTVMIGLTLGVVWEFLEWFFLVVLNVRVGVGYGDTIADLAMDILGSLIAGAALVAWTAQAATESSEEPAPAPAS